MTEKLNKAYKQPIINFEHKISKTYVVENFGIVLSLYRFKIIYSSLYFR